MHTRYFYTSLTRISDLSTSPFDVEVLPRSQWATGDYVVAEVVGKPNSLYRLELENGRMIEVVEGDFFVGAFGKRSATLEGVGDWKKIGDDLRMEALTSAGLLGKATSTSPFLPHFMSLVYTGHAVRAGNKVCMMDFVETLPDQSLQIPIVLLVGTSMSAGKTTSARIIVHELKRRGLTVVGAKLTGAARYRDTLGMGDAGADYIFDFVDAGIPSTVCPAEDYRVALRRLLSRIAQVDADVLVAEVGASPLEPYNGTQAIREISSNIKCTVLCASDPYAVLGVKTAFDIHPDLVAGPAANTDAAINLVEKLAGAKALNIIERKALPALREILETKLGYPV